MEAICCKKKRKSKEREDKVEMIISELKDKHQSKYTPMQYRIWTEMIVDEIHDSTCVSPITSMFKRAGGTTNKDKSLCSTSDIAKESPVNVIDSRTKCYKQLSDLKALYDSGILSMEEYDNEKSTIMSILQKLV